MAALGLVLPIITQAIHLIYPHILPEFVAPITGYLGFCLLGYALANTEFSRAWRIVIYLLGIVGLGGFIFGSAYLIEHRPTFVPLVHGYLAVPAILWASAVLVFCKYSRIGQCIAHGAEYSKTPCGPHVRGLSGTSSYHLNSTGGQLLSD